MLRKLKYLILLFHFLEYSITLIEYILFICSLNIALAIFLFIFMVGVKISLSTVKGSIKIVICLGFSKLLNLFAVANSIKSS